MNYSGREEGGGGEGEEREGGRDNAGNIHVGNNGDIGIVRNACANIIGNIGTNGNIGIVGNAGNVDLYTTV